MNRSAPGHSYVRRHHVGLLALFIALGGTSYAAVGALPAKDGSIRTCVKKRGGAVRFVGPTSRCAKSERTLRINQRGVAGLAGVAGPRGADGTNGLDGRNGLDGKDGPPGPTAGAVGGNAGTPPTGATTVVSQALTTTSAGRLWVSGRFDTANWQCLNFGNCTLTVGLYVDGAPVPQTLATDAKPAGGSVGPMNATFGPAGSYSRFGITAASVPAGPHTVSIAYKVVAGLSAAGLESPANASVGAILLGG